MAIVDIEEEVNAVMIDKNKPLISVVVPVYKVEKYLKKCVESILAQSYTIVENFAMNFQRRIREFV